MGYKGDVNLDGKIEIDDVALIQAHILGTVTLSFEQQYYANINGEGGVTTQDAALLNRHLLGTAVIIDDMIYIQN